MCWYAREHPAFYRSASSPLSRAMPLSSHQQAFIPMLYVHTYVDDLFRCVTYIGLLTIRFIRIIMYTWPAPDLPWQMVSQSTRNRTEKKNHGTRREFLRENLYKNIAIIAIMYFVDTFGDFSLLLGEIYSSPSAKFPYIY